MVINLTNEFFIEVDPLNFTLKERYFNEKTGKSGIRIHGYFGKLDHAVDKFLKVNQNALLADKAMEMSEYVKKVEQCNKAAVQAVRSVLEGDDGK